MKKLSEIYNINENLQLADKVYFKNGILSDKVKQIILDKITNGDVYTKLIADMVYTISQNDKRVSNWLDSTMDSDTPEDANDKTYSVNDYLIDIKDWKKIKGFYNELKEYNKNVFPIKGYNLNQVENINYFMSALKQRRLVIELMKKLPSIAKRNLKNDIRIERDYPQLQEYRSNLEYVEGHLSLLNNRPDNVKDNVLKKIFKSNITLSDVMNFIDDKETLIGGYEFNKENVLSLISDSESQELEVIYKKGEIMVVEVTGPNGIKEIGCNSLWCFTYDNNNSWSNNWYTYSYNDMVYIIIDFTEDSDSPEFMRVLIKPIDFSVISDEYGDEEEDINDSKLFDMSNHEIYNPLSILNSTLGLNTARKLLTFGDEPQKLPRKKREMKKDPNQLEFSFESRLSKIYQELISEDLEYAHTTTNGPESDKFQIGVNEDNHSGNYGYHVGDLKDKSEVIGDKALGTRQLAKYGGTASRTGQFGAGHFFFGSLGQAKEYQKVKARKILKVDFSQYNLYRPSNPKEFVESTISLTNALVMVPKGYTEDQEFITLINDLSEDLPYFGINLSKEKIYEITSGFVYDVTTGSNPDGDYLITRYLKAVGYEGIDLRDTPYDSFFIGSVIYDIKPNSVSTL